MARRRLGGGAGRRPAARRRPGARPAARATPAPPADFALVLAPAPRRRGRTAGSRWPDFWVPTDRGDALDALREAHRRAAAGERVEVACRGGIGRTGTALAALAVLDGLTPADAVAWVRARLPPRARSRRPGSGGGCAGSADRTPSSGGTRRAAGPLGCPYNCTGGEWSRLRSCDQGKRAEEGNDDLVNHPLQTNKCRFQSARLRSRCLTAARRVCQPGFVIGPDPGIS